MKEALNYYYDIKIEDIEVLNKYSVLKTFDNNNFLLIESENEAEIKNHIILYLNTFFRKQNKYHIKLNNLNDFITKINDKYYLLIKLPSSYLDDVDIEDITVFSQKNIQNTSGYNLKWDMLWEDKVNYLNNYILNNESKYKKEMPYIYYYIGICECCIIYLRSFFHQSRTINLIPTICHRRLYYPLKEIYLNNPFNFVVDIAERDIAEYIKSLFYMKNDYLNELDFYLKTNPINKYQGALLYIRLVYPSYFLDYIESGKEIYMSKQFYDTNEYENFIKKTYELINSYVNIPKIDWL